MSRLSKTLAVPMAVAFMLAAGQMPLAAGAPASAQAETAAKPRKARAAGRAAVTVQAARQAVIEEVTQLFVEQGYQKGKSKKADRLVFEQTATDEIVDLVLGTGYTGAATTRVTVRLKDKKGGTRVIARMELVTSAGEQVPVSADAATQELKAALRMVKANFKS